MEDLDGKGQALLPQQHLSGARLEAMPTSLTSEVNVIPDG